MFQAKKWGWKRVAANLLLVPVLAGGSAAAVAHAQFGKPAVTMPSRTAPAAKSAPATRTAQPATRMAAPAARPAAPAAAAAPAARPAGAVATGDPKQLLKDGRKALAEGRLAEAQDLAMAAEANNPSGKWGLFDDTPNALRKDVQAALTKAQKAQAEELVKQAKALLKKPAANDGERAYNLDAALTMARKADQLHGPYSSWDFGDRADKLVKELEAARAKLKVAPASTAVAANPNTRTPNPRTPTAPGPGAVAGAQPPRTGPGTMAGAQPPRAKPGAQPTFAGPLPSSSPGVQQAGADARKATAAKLLAEGRMLSDQGNFAAAKAKFVEADRLGLTYVQGEPNPGFALQELNARGAATIDKLIRDANALAAQRDYAKAEASLNAAGAIAGTLGLFPRPIEEAKAALRAAAGKPSTIPPGPAGPGAPRPGAVAQVTPTNPAVKPATPAVSPKPVTPPGGAAAGNTPAGGTPAGGKPAVPPTGAAPAPGALTGGTPAQPMTGGAPTPPKMVSVMPKGPLPGATTAEPPIAVAPPPAGGNPTGRQLLDQAAYEFKKGEFDTAEKLAVQAHNLGVQEEARGLLNSIAAEKHSQKMRVAARSLENARTAFQNKDYSQALGVLVLVEPNLLTPEARGQREQMLAACKVELDKGGLVAAGGTQPSDTPPTAPTGPAPGMTPGPMPGVAAPPGVARVGPGGPDNPTAQADALRKVQVQKLRSEGLKAQADAQAAFGRGETDLAMQLLMDYSNRVRASGLDPSTAAMLLRQVEAKLDTFRMMKAQVDTVARQNKDKRDARELVAGRGVAEEMRKQEVATLVRRYNDLIKKNDFVSAERVALQAKQLDPDDPAVSALYEMAKMRKRVKIAEQDKADKEAFTLGGLNDADRYGPLVTTNDPVAVQLQTMQRANRRGSGNDLHLRTRTPAEHEIELRMEKPIQVEFRQTPLNLAIENLQQITGLPLWLDEQALRDERISEVQPTNFNVGTAIATKNVLACMLEPVGLNYVIEHDVVKITTTKKAKGRLYTKVFSVADLVTPVPNFALPDHAQFDKMLNRNALGSGNVAIQGLTPGGGATPYSPAGGLGGGAPTGSQATMPGIQGALPFGPGGTLQASPLSGSTNIAPANNSKHEQLIKLITSMVRPYSWDGHGGPGKVEFFDIGSALVVNQTADVIQEVADLLEALRRLQDLAIAVEVRIVSLAESFFERMGLDFSMNIKTNTTSFEPALTSGVFRPEPFINDINHEGVTVGLTPAGTFTPDLDVPIRATSFQRAIPGFGNYPNNPGNNGGVSLGLAFLNDIQVFMFLELAQGDMRSNIMQAPKLTLFNGQTATLTVTDTQFFVTSVTVVSVNGQIVFIPNNTPLPGTPDTNFSLAIQAVVSADRRFVRLNLPISMAAQSGASVPLFPITTFITPVFEGGSQGQPIPFTQFLQQPSFTNLDISTTVVCPDGGTVLLGGLKTVRESRNEFGPPFLSKIPYLNRLFKNVGVGRETRHIMLMVTPRIIITSEEEIFQTEGRQPGLQP